MTKPESTSLLPPGPVEPYTLDTNAETFSLLRELVDRHGEIVRLNSPERKRPCYLIANPEHIRQVLIGNHANYIKGVGFERVEMLLGNGIIVSNGSFWRRQRTMMQPAFSRSNTAKFFTTIKQANLKIIEDWDHKARAGAAIDITKTMSEYALEVMLKTIFSEDLEYLASEAGENPFAFLADDPSRDLVVAVKFRRIRKLVLALIRRRRERNERPFDLLSMMMDASDKKTGECMTDDQLVDEVSTLIVAGHETSAGTLNWAWYLLSAHPQCEQAVSAESLAVAPDGELKYEDLAELQFTRQVLQETLRLYPPVWLFTRKAVDSDEIGGYVVEPGTNIFLSPYLTQRLPQYWDQPDEFRPERFSDGRLSDSYAFFPFSAGPRRCIGEHFAFIEMQTHLAMLSSRFRLTHLPERPVELEPAINLRTKHSLYMSLSPKSKQ